VGVGSRYEAENQAGISHFVEHVFFRGTAKRPTSCDISAEIEGVGGVLNAATDRETTVYWCKVPQAHFELGLDVLCDMLLNACFRSEDVEKERTVIIEEINMSYDAPASRVSLLIDELLWNGHPLGRDIAGNKDSVNGISRTELRTYVSRRYRPARAVVSIAGNVDHDSAVESVKKRLGHWTASGQVRGFAPYVEKPGRRVRVEFRDIEQAHVCLSLPGFSIFDPRHYTLDIINVLLGEGMSCRLFTHVRDELGLAYSVHSYVEHLSDAGALTVYAGVDTNKLEMALEAVVRELTRIRDEFISAEELAKAKEQAKGHLLLRLEDSRNVAGWQGGQEIIKGEILTVDEVIEKIDAVTTDSIGKIASELFQPERLRLAIVGPVKETAGLKQIIKAE
jgi:predicted Zn-dependent peptidase